MAGVWSVLEADNGDINGKYSELYEFSKYFTDDAASPSIPDTDFEDISGFLIGARVKFDGSTPPNTATVTIKDKNGVELVSGTVTASGIIDVDNPIPFINGLTVSVSGNTTNSAIATIYLYIF